MRRARYVSACVAPIALIGGWTWAASQQPAHYNPLTDTISALAARGAQDRWIMTGALVLLGLCHVVTALLLVEARPAGRAALAAGGLATLAVAALPQPSAGHAPAATVAFVALTIWPALGRLPTRRASTVASSALLCLLVWFFVALQTGELVGLSERGLSAVQALWPLVTVLALTDVVRNRSVVPTRNEDCAGDQFRDG